MSRKSIASSLALLFVLSASLFILKDISASEISVLFSPKDECGKVILNNINGAEKSIELAMYYFTSRPISRALAAAVKRGVKVRMFLDGESARERYSKYSLLKKSGVLVKLEKGEGLMHNKFCIIDNNLLITGSYNWTTSADLRNDENVMLIRSKEVIKAYRVQFEKYWRGDYPDEAYYLNKRTLEKLK